MKNRQSGLKLSDILFNELHVSLAYKEYTNKRSQPFVCKNKLRLIHLEGLVNMIIHRTRTLVPRGTNRSGGSIVAFKLALFM